ncbi:hypothetical protein OTU49_001126 [Cherax quadricarinatus]|uniref:HTH psq-type domain-containing protein n=2 Tax=Cherax quadricarinatus TaxID=27406 RepID=A0AAW0XGB1_CHEQU
MNFYHDDPVMGDLDDDDDEDDEVHQHVEHSAQGQRKKSDPALDLMAMYEEVEVDEAHSGVLANSEDNSRGLKRVQIKLEHGTGIGETHVQTSVENPPVMSTHLHPQQAHQSSAPFLTTQDIDIHKESIEMREDHQGAETRATIRISHGEDPLAQAVKVTQTSEDMTEPNVPNILTSSGTMIRMGDPPHTSTSIQDTIDVQEESGVILLGLSDGEPQGRVYAGGSSHTSTPITTQSLRPTHPRRFRKYSKQDLITALNLVRDGHLGIKPAARAFNIPVATLYNVTKRHNVSSPMQQGANEKTWRDKGSLVVSTDGRHFQCLPSCSSMLPDS